MGLVVDSVEGLRTVALDTPELFQKVRDETTGLVAPTSEVELATGVVASCILAEVGTADKVDVLVAGKS